MTSIKDVAQRAGVGVATVSRVLNETGYVSAETRKKVQDAMEELNYIPNELARNLLHKKAELWRLLYLRSLIRFLQNLYCMQRKNC